MARIRSYRPDLWDCDDFTAMSPAAQVCLFRLMTHVSDKGRIKCRPAFLMSRLYPDGDVGKERLEELLEEVCSAGFATPYQSGGKAYLQIVWDDETSPIRQVINRPSKCGIPSPADESSEPFNSWLSEGLMEGLTAARIEGSVSDSSDTARGTGRDWTGPDWTGRESPGRSLTVPSSGSGHGLRSVSGSGSAGGRSSASAPPVEKSEREPPPLASEEALNTIRLLVAAENAGRASEVRYHATRLAAKGHTKQQIRCAVEAHRATGETA